MKEKYIVRVDSATNKKIEVLEVMPHVRDSVPLFLKHLQTLVGGRIETVRIDESIVAVVNEEGRIRRLLKNMHVKDMTPLDLYGDVVLLKRDEDRLVCLNADDIRLLAEWL